MIYVHIKKELSTFETDIRDLCLAFFTLQKITYVFDDAVAANETVVANEAVGANFRNPRTGELCEPADIHVDNYYDGPVSGDRLLIKSELKRSLYNYLSKLTGKTLLWGTLTGIRPVNIVTKIIEDNIVATNVDTVGANFRSPRTGELCEPTFVGATHREPVGASYASAISDSEIKSELKKEYYISDLKANELINIAHKEIEILNRPEVKNYKDTYSIYVGVPFCKSTCLYCSFTSFNIEKFSKYVDTYLDALEKDFAIRVNSIIDKARATRPYDVGANFRSLHTGELCETTKLTPLTLYIGGGTPTSLDETAFEKMLAIIDKYVDRSSCVEYTVEAGRPDTITKEKLLIMKKHGVTRISINPQSFNQKTLDLIGRKHTVKDVIEKFKLARSLGFDNINMDIILGLPNEHLFQVLKTLNGIRKLKPDSFTVHSLALKRAARLNFELDSWTKNYYLAGLGNRRSKLCEPEGNREIDKMFKWSARLANFLHLEPYYLYRQKNMAGNLENVGYAKDGKECIYNIMMMSERHSVYGFGTATTKEVFYQDDGSKRIESEEGYKSVIDYCKSYNTI